MSSGISNMMDHDWIEYDCLQQAMMAYPFRMIPQSYFDRVKALMDKWWSKERMEDDFISNHFDG